jgi:hypothetical protein
MHLVHEHFAECRSKHGKCVHFRCRLMDDITETLYCISTNGSEKRWQEESMRIHFVQLGM